MNLNTLRHIYVNVHLVTHMQDEFTVLVEGPIYTLRVHMNSDSNKYCPDSGDLYHKEVSTHSYLLENTWVFRQKPRGP